MDYKWPVHQHQGPDDGKWLIFTPKFRYNRTVFIAPPWREIYVQDAERKQSFDVAVSTYQAMMKAYREYDYQLIELPCVPVDERVDFILSVIG